MGYSIPVRDGPGALPDLESCWDVAAVSRHLEIQVYLLAVELDVDLFHTGLFSRCKIFGL